MVATSHESGECASSHDWGPGTHQVDDVDGFRLMRSARTGRVLSTRLEPAAKPPAQAVAVVEYLVI